MKFVLILLLILLESLAANASLYDTRIDYWSEEVKEVNESAEPVETPSNEFSWEDAMNPNNDEFYRRGDHMPPAPLVEVMKNPTDYNIKKYYELEAKREQKLSEFIKKSEKYRLASIEKELRKVSKPTIKKDSFYNVRANRSKYRLRMYFDSRCPHCKRMYQELLVLSREGYSVELVQIDMAPNPFKEIITRKIRPGEREKVRLNNGGVPLTLVLNNKTKKVGFIRGYKSLGELRTILK